jgi:ferric-dicitrate binding protein FerR (iron transport regulator)
MGRQWNTIIESLGPLSGGTMSINANLTEIEALLTTLQADVADGIPPIRGTTSTGTLTAGTTNGTLFATNSTRNYLLVQCTSGTVFIDTNGTASATEDIQLTAGQGITFEGSFIPTGAIAAITSAGTARIIGVQG